MLYFILIDLFYRISVIEIPLPSLREHKEDIPLLVEHFTSQSSAGRNKVFAQSSLNILTEYHWPGNVRQLRNIVEHAILMAENDFIEPKHLLIPGTGKIDRSTGQSLAEIEKSAIQYALKSSGGNKTVAAKTLGIAYSTLYEKMKKYGLSSN